MTSIFFTSLFVAKTGSAVSRSSEEKSYYRIIKASWVCVFLILTLLGFESASPTTNTEGIHVVEDTQGPFRPRIINYTNLSHREAVLEIDVTAIELGELTVTLKEDFVQGRNSVNTTQPYADILNETKLSKEHCKPHANVSLQSSTGKRPIPHAKPLPDKQLVQSKVIPASSSPIWLIWPGKTWDILSDEIIYVLGWKELPKGINQNCFNWRSVTRSAMDSPCPGYGETEYHSSSSNGNQSDASITTDRLRQQRNHIIPDATLDDDRNWSPEDIALENEYKILQHGNDPNDQKGYHGSMSDGNQSTGSTKTDESSQGTDNQTLQHEDHPKNIKLSKELRKLNVSLQNTGANYPHGSSTGKRPIPRPKRRPDNQLVQSKVLLASSSPIWLILPRKTWNILSDEIIQIFGWKELSKGINHNCFNLRSVTRSAMDSSSPRCGQKEYHISHAAAVNQSTASNEKDCYWSPDDISSGNHNETLQHRDDRNKQKEYHSSISDGNQSTYSTKRDKSGQGMDLIPKPTDNGTRRDEDHPNKTNVSKELPMLNVSLQNIGANYSRGSSIGNRTIPHPKLLSDKQLDPSKVLPASSSSRIWLISSRKIWNVVYNGFIYAFGWKELPKGINQNCFSWKSVSRSAMVSVCPGYGCEDPAKYLRSTPEDAPGDKVTESSIIPANSKPSITDNTAIAKINESKEIHHVPFVMRMPKDYEWNRLPERITSENEEKPMPPKNLTDNRNNNNSFESQNNPTEGKTEYAWSMIVDNVSRVNNECRWPKKSGNASCMDNEDNVLDFLENETSSSIAENKSSDKVNSSENKGTELEKLLEINQLGRSYGNLSTFMEKSGDATARFKDLDNVSVESGITAHVLTNWSWQDTFDVLIISWMINFCLVDLYLTGCFIKEIIGQLRLPRQRQQDEECERLRELKPWRPKPKKRRRKKKNDW